MSFGPLLPGFPGKGLALGYRRRWMVTILALQIGAVVFEALGLAAVIPILEYMSAPAEPEAMAQASVGWRYLLSFAETLGVQLGFGALLGLAFLAILVRQGFLYARLVTTAYFNGLLVRRLRERGLSLYLDADTGARDSVRTGTIVNDFTVEPAQAVSCITGAISTLSYLILLGAYVVLTLTLSVSLGITAFALIAGIGAILLYITRRIRQIGREVTAANQDVTSFLMERLSSAHLVRLSGMERAEIEDFAATTERQRQRVFDLQRTVALFSVTLEPMVLLSGFVLLYVAVQSNLIGFEALLLFFVILLRLVPVAKEMMLSRQTYVSSLASIETILKRLSYLASAREIDTGTMAMSRLMHGIAFADVSFSYPGGSDAPALRRIDLEIPARKLTAIVGPSGAGKSTMVDLIPRLRLPTGGEIRIDGVPANDLTLASLRSNIAFAPQRPQLFDVSIRDHILYGKPDASETEIIEAARLAQLLPFIESLPGGLATPIGENGGRLSGGQRHRLDLARALVRGASILILDEPTASLDAESTALFYRAIKEIRASTDTTMILIGHHLALAEIADRIVVVLDGRIEAQGTHKAVLHGSSWYGRALGEQERASRAG